MDHCPSSALSPPEDEDSWVPEAIVTVSFRRLPGAISDVMAAVDSEVWCKGTKLYSVKAYAKKQLWKQFPEQAADFKDCVLILPSAPLGTGRLDKNMDVLDLLHQQGPHGHVTYHGHAVPRIVVHFVPKSMAAVPEELVTDSMAVDDSVTQVDALVDAMTEWTCAK